mgnify:CR=1 FL=1
MWQETRRSEGGVSSFEILCHAASSVQRRLRCPRVASWALGTQVDSIATLRAFRAASLFALWTKVDCTLPPCDKR